MAKCLVLAQMSLACLMEGPTRVLRMSSLVSSVALLGQRQANSLSDQGSFSLVALAR